jgi:hypothetical protein
LQVLLVAEREARGRGLQLRLHRPSRVVCDVLQTLNLTTRFQTSNVTALKSEAAPIQNSEQDSESTSDEDRG